MIGMKDDLNSVGSIPITRAQKHRIMHLCNFWAAQPVESCDWMRVTPEMYESWFTKPVVTPSQPTPTPAPIVYDQFAKCYWLSLTSLT